MKASQNGIDVNIKMAKLTHLYIKTDLLLILKIICQLDWNRSVAWFTELKMT